MVWWWLFRGFLSRWAIILRVGLIRSIGINSVGDYRVKLRGCGINGNMVSHPVRRLKVKNPLQPKGHRSFLLKIRRFTSNNAADS